MSNQRLVPVYGFQQEDASLELLSDQLSSMNFDGAITRVYVQKAVSSVVPGDAIHFSSSQQDEVVPVLVSSVELNDSEDPLYQTNPMYFIYYIDEEGEDQSYSLGAVTTDGGYVGTELVYTSYEDPTTIDVGTSGWTITKYGNAVFSNVFTRGTIEATAGKIDGILTIGSDNNTAIQLGKGISIPGDTNVYNGLVINDTNYFVTKELASSTYTISSATTATESVSSGLSLVTFTINSHGLFTNATGSKIVRLFGFTGGLVSLNNSWTLNTSSTNTVTVIVPRITAGTYSGLTAQLEQDGIAIRKSVTSAVVSDVANVTNTNITFTTSANHNFVANNSVNISSLPSNLENVNGNFTVSSVTANTFTIKNVTVTGTSPYTGLSGSVFKLFNTERSVFNVGSGTNFMNYDSATDLLQVTGKIVSGSGSIGGWNLEPTEFYSGTGSSRIAFNSSTGVIAIGTGNHGSADTGFYVDKTGKFSLSNQLIFNPGNGVGSSFNTTGTFTTSAATITVPSGLTIIKGMTVTGTGIDTNTYVTNVSGTTITISKTPLSNQTGVALTFVLDDFAELQVVGRIKGVIDSTQIIGSPRLSTTISQVVVSGTSPNQTAVITTSGHAFIANEKILIESLPVTAGLNNLNRVEGFVIATVTDSVTLSISLSGVTGVTSTTTSGLSGVATLRELTMGLHPQEGTGTTYQHSQGTGIRLDKYNWWFTNNQFRVGTSGSFFNWNGSKFNIQGGGDKTLSLSVGALNSDNSFSIYTTSVGSPSYANANTPFYVDGTGKFSLGSALTWDGSTLTISGSSSGIQPGNGVEVNGSNQITQISGDRIRTGTIESFGYSYTSGNFSTVGTQLNLTDGLLRSKNFSIDSSGNAFFKGDITGASGTFSGSLSAVTGSFSNLTASGKLTANGSTEIGNNLREAANYSGIAISNLDWHNSWLRRDNGSIYFKAGATTGLAPYIQMDTSGTSAIVFPNFSVNSAGTVSVTGAINASSGSFSGYVSTSSGARFGTNVSSTNDGLWLNASNYFLFNGTVATFRVGSSTAAFVQIQNSDASTRLQVDTTNSTYAVEIGGSLRVNGTSAYIYGDLIGTASNATNAGALDSINSTSFLRSDVSDSFTGQVLTINNPNVTESFYFSYSGAEPMLQTTGTNNLYGTIGTSTDAIYFANFNNLRVDNVNVTSDTRTKKDVSDSDLGIDFINNLRPVKFKKIDGKKKIFNEDGSVQEFTPGTRWHYGFIAQELKEELDSLGVDSSMWALEDNEEFEGGLQTINYLEMISPAIKAIQELSETVEILKNRLAALES